MALRSIRRILTALLFLTPTLAQAAPQPQARTFVSAKKGSDSANCGRTSPCRTFNRAISLTSPGGEVVVLDSGGYGAVTISQAITLEAPEGVYAGMTVSSGDGITVAAGASDVVVLRGLTLVGAGTSGNGITVASAGTVHVEHCTIQGFSAGNGIVAKQGVFLYLYLEDSQVFECKVGVNVLPATTQVYPSYVAVSRSRFEGSLSWALLLEGADGSNTIHAIVTESTIGGLFGGVSGGDSVSLVVDRCVFASLGSGVPDVVIAGNGVLVLTNSVMPNVFQGVRVDSTDPGCEMGNNYISNVVGTIGQCSLR